MLREHKSCPMDTVGTWGLVLTRVFLEVSFPFVTVDCVPAFLPVLQWALREVPVPCKSNE